MDYNKKDFHKLKNYTLNCSYWAEAIWDLFLHIDFEF